MTTRQLQNESDKAYAAFMEYARLGPERSMREVARRLGKSLTLLVRWAKRHSWQERIETWNAEQDEIFQKAQENELRKKAELWAKRQAEMRDREWTTAQRLRELAEKMLKMPLVMQKTSKDGKSIRIEPVKWSFGDAVRALQLAGEIERLACGLPTGKNEVTGNENAPIMVQTAPVVIYIPDNGRDGKKE